MRPAHFFNIALLLALLLASPAGAQVKRYAIVTGDPCCGIPDEQYKYMDANAGCVAEVQVPPSTMCVINKPGTLRSFLGPQPTQPSTCVYNWDCLCGNCLIGDPSDQRNFDKISVSQTNAHGQAMSPCTGGSLRDFVSCVFHKAKTKGCCAPGIQRANPVNVLSRNKFQGETVYGGGSGDLQLALWYNSQPGVHYFRTGAFGTHWAARYFVAVKDSFQGIVAVQRPDGKEVEFTAPQSGAFYLKDADVNETLERLLDAGGATLGWRIVDARNDEVEDFDAAGRLTAVRNRAGRQVTLSYSTTATPPVIAPEPGLLVSMSDHFGRQLNFTYDAQKRVAKLIDPAGGETLFEYDGSSGPAGGKNLTKVTYPDLTTRVYHYAEAAHINGGAACSTPPANLPNLLTGLTDEKGVRFATWTYDCTGRVTGSEHAGSIDKYTFTGHGTFVTVVDPLNTSRDVYVAAVLGTGKESTTVQPAASGSGTVQNAFTYDAQGNVASRTDYNGSRTNYTYDLSRNLETQRIEGLTASGGATPQTRTISTQWDTTFRLPTGVAEPLRITTFAYDPDSSQCGARGALCSKTIQATSDAGGSQGFSATPVGAARAWTYTYNANGDVLTVNGPRTDVADVTTYTYYPNNDPDLGKRGKVATITNAAGHTTSISDYNAHGQPLTMVDPNGLTTTMTYDARLRLRTRNVGGELTTYDYDGVGQLTKVTLPDGSFLEYGYDSAHRLTGMQDNLGNRIAYTLDAMGNRTQEQVLDPANQLAQTRSRVFNNLNRLFRELGAQNQTTEYAYDDQGNVISVKDPLNRVTSNQYDALNRLRQVTSPGPVSAVTQYAYNGLDALTQVTDPRSLVTGYTVDGLGNLNVQTSPDTGITINTYDVAGNLLTQTDAKGQTTTYVYDALNRVTLITFHDGSKQAYAYDQGPNGIGRLSSITETDPADQVTSVIAYAYDQHGRVTSETRAISGVPYVLAYAYDAAGRLAGLTYPSGRALAYGFDSLGRVSQITTTKDNETQTVVQAVQYHPFGGVKGYTLGNGQVYARGIDLDGRIASYTLGSQSFAIGYDAASRISFISDAGNPANTNTYGYDELDRLTGAVLPTTPYAYSYDAIGNRTSRTAGSSTDTYAYSSTSNRIASITPASGPVRNFMFDPNGSTTADGVNTYAYDARGRMVQATSSIGATSYQVNALGQRIRKSNSLGDTVFHYDTRGRLIAETSPSGTLKRELIYLGHIPVGVVQ